MTTVLLVEDDPAISEPLPRALGRDGYDVRAHATGAEALADIRGVDLVVLDLGLPDMDGLDVAREVRASGNRVPILILTARTDEVDMVVGLDAGADDYVTKPFRLACAPSCAARSPSPPRVSCAPRTSAWTSPPTAPSSATSS